LVARDADATAEARLMFTTETAKRLTRRAHTATRLVRSPGQLAKAARALLDTLITEGPRGVVGSVRSIWNRLDRASSNSYDTWIKRYDDLGPVELQEIRNHLRHWDCSVRISVVMPVYNAPEAHLRKAIDSVRAQLYENWELCVADDCSTASHVRRVLEDYLRIDRRIKVAFRATNGHISAASNSALELASGDYIALLDQDDELSPHALYLVAHAVSREPEADIIYSDEDKIDVDGRRYDPYFKCAWNEGLFLSHNLISHLGVYRTELVKQLGGFREGYEGSQDYDLALRCLSQSRPERIIHIPFVLYHWRAAPGSTAAAPGAKRYAHTAAQLALNDHFQRVGSSGRVTEGVAQGFNRASFDLPNPPPAVSIIVPINGGSHVLARCVRSVLNTTRYPDYEVLLVGSCSLDIRTLPYSGKLAADPRVRLISHEAPCSYSRLNNFAVTQSGGSVICLLDHRTEVITPGWLEEMVSHASRPPIGAVGAKLLYPDGTVQHAGLILGIRGVAGYVHRHLTARAPGYFGRAIIGQELSAVAAACLVVRREVYEQVGGLAEDRLTVAFNDIDFCLRLKQAGYRNYWTPYAVVRLHESKARRGDDNPGTRARLMEDSEYMHSRWREWLESDPAYNPNLTLETEDCSPAFPPRVDRPWRSPGFDALVT
jgi:glycosyltransferase involved in cell wall biosynthesis